VTPEVAQALKPAWRNSDQELTVPSRLIWLPSAVTLMFVPARCALYTRFEVIRVLASVAENWGVA
jgi:hypothetical protein